MVWVKLYIKSNVQISTICNHQAALTTLVQKEPKDDEDPSGSRVTGRCEIYRNNYNVTGNHLVKQIIYDILLVSK